MTTILRQTYRLYPTHYQESVLLKWEDSLRWFWNLSLEWSKLALKSCDYKNINAITLNGQIPELKVVAPWVKEPPAQSLQVLTLNLEKAWKSCFLKLKKAPKFKKFGRDRISITENQKWSLSNTHLKFTKIGKIRYVKDRDLLGTPKSCSISQNATGQWYVSIVCHLEDKVIPSRTNNPVGVDVGVVKLLADSNGNFIENPKFYTKAMDKLAKAQRNLSRKKKDSNNRAKAKLVVTKRHQKIRFQRKDFLHKLSTTYSKNHGIIVLEDLKINNMTKIGGGLSRSILDSGWGMFREMLEYKQRLSGGSVIRINPAYTSQTCSECGCVARENRLTQSRFVCISCEHTANADTNAARVILAIGMGNTRKLVERGSYSFVEARSNTRLHANTFISLGGERHEPPTGY